MLHKKNTDKILAIIKDSKQKNISKLLSQYNPIDLAEIINDAPSLQQKTTILSSLETKVAAQAFPNISIDYQKNILKNLPLKKTNSIFKEIPLDELADILNNLNDDQLSEKISSGLNIKTQKDLEKILDFDEESAGGIMTPELCALPKDYTVKQAINIIKKSSLKDIITTVFVIIPHNKTLIGVIPLLKLVSSSENEVLENLANPNYHCVTPETDQEEIAQLFRKYKLYVVPVVNSQHQILGRITVDDILNISYEEAREDIALMSGTPDILFNKHPLRKIIFLRMPWLILTLLLAIINCVVIEKMNLQSSVILATFIPIVMAMGGNTGIQSATVLIREISLGNRQTFFKTTLKEVISGLTLGIVCGSLAAFLVLIITNILNINTGDISKNYLSILVFLSLSITMGFSSFFGSSISIVLHKLSIDPALAAGPFITTLNDIISSTIYFTTSYFLLELTI